MVVHGKIKHFTFAMAAMLFAAPVFAQIQSVDPNEDFSRADTAPQQPVKGNAVGPASGGGNGDATLSTGETVPAMEGTSSQTPPSPTTTISPTETGTYRKDDLISAAEGVFGKGSAGIAKMIEGVLKDQGEPNAYIAGREASGAFILGVRYGSGTMTHSVEGQRAVYWTGPSIGFDAGGDAAKVFVLVYNLYDSQDLFKRYPQIEGRAYYFGGLSGTYLRRGSVAMIPIRLGVGMRLGANVGYMRFSEKARWLPL
jgi:hypothetical protein